MLHLALALIAVAGLRPDADVDVAIDAAVLRSGDVILHTSTSSQAPAIVVASGSLYSHVGVVSVEGGGVFVVEAAGSVKKTPLQQFLRRGVDGRYTVLRHKTLDDKAARAVTRAAKRHLGKPYDLAFARGDGALYCSELVAVAYAAAGFDVGAWQKLADLHLDNPVVEKLLEKRWKKHPACKGQRSLEACQEKLRATEVITPASLRDDERFDVVLSTYPPGLG